MTPNPHSQPLGSPMRKRRGTSLYLSVLLALSSGACFAQAQSTQTPAPKPEEAVVELDKVVVSGIRSSMTKAIDYKRESMQMVDSIVAEDIGKFPDNNVVEALQRVSGVQVTNRGSGEVATVSIRGLDDITTTINGMNIFTASGRSVALADIPASLLSRVDVYKTRSADLIETGIAGQIDIRTHRPFDFKGSKIVLAARGIMQEQNEKIGPNLSALFSKTWNTSAGKFGALIDVSMAETKYRDQSVTAGAMVPFMTNNPAPGWTPYERIFLTDGRVTENPIWQAGLEAGLPFAANSTLAINGVQTPYVLSRDAIFASDFTGTRKRPAVNVSMQFAPNENSEYTFEAFYNGYRNDSFNNLLFSFVDWWGALSSNPSADVTLYPGTNIVKSRKNVGFPYGFMSGDLTTGKTDSYIYSLGGKWTIGDKLKLKADASYQKSDFNQDFIAMRTERVARSIDVDFNAGDNIPAFKFGDDTTTSAVDESDLTDASQWTIAQLYDNGIMRKGDAITLSADGEYNAGWKFFDKIKFGVRYDDRMASEGSRTQDTGVLGQKLSDYPELQHVNSGFFDGRSDVPSSWVVANGYTLRDNADHYRSIYKSTIAPNLKLSDTLAIHENFKVQEATSSAYLMTNFKTFIGNRKLDGQMGFRYVGVSTDMDFTDINTNVKSSASASTDKMLPSASLRFGITDDLYLRASYGETLRRPGFASLNPNITYVKDVTNIGYGTASGGNPNLKPTQSKNYDLSLEYFFGKASAVYATAFKREIEGFVTDYRRRITYENYDYILTQPDNASNGELTGYEFGLVYFPDNLPSLLQGLGVQASYTMLDSSQDIPITNSAGVVTGTDTTPMFGVSDSSYSVVLAYERKKFSARLSYVWRKDFLNNYEAAQFANPLGIYRNPEKSMDFQLSYQVNKNMVVTFDATNLTDEIYQSYYEYPSTHNFGSSIYSRTFALGVRYSF